MQWAGHEGYLSWPPQEKNVNDFWKEIKIIHHKNMTLPSSIDGVIETENISEMRGKHYKDLFSSVKRD